MKKKLICRVASILLCAFFCQQSAFAAWYAIPEYDRYNPSPWAKEAVCHLEYYGFIQREEIPNTDFNGMKWYKDPIRRDAIAHLLVSLYEFNTGTKVTMPEYYPLNPWPYNGFESSVKKAYGIGLMQGCSETEFGYWNITRQQFAVVLYRAAKVMDFFAGDAEPYRYADEDMIADWALDAVSYAQQTGIMIGTAEDVFSPEDFVTKEMVYTCIHRFALTNGIYEKLSDEQVDSIEFTPKKPISGDIDRLCAAVSEQERQVIEKALKLFPNAFEIHAYTTEISDSRKGEYAKLIIYSDEGDFVLILAENGIFSSIKFSNGQYEKYKDLIFSVIDISRYKGIYLEKYENVRQTAWDSKDKWYYETEDFGESDRIVQGTWACIDVEYEETYGAMSVEINDIYIG